MMRRMLSPPDLTRVSHSKKAHSSRREMFGHEHELYHVNNQHICYCARWVCDLPGAFYRSCPVGLAGR